MPLNTISRAVSRRPVTQVAAVAALSLGACAAVPAAASASHQQITIIQDQSVLADPSGVTAQFRALGANTERIFMPWTGLAPNPRKTKAPKNFTATNPAAYSLARWAAYDNADRAAAQDGMTIELVVTGGAPRWAEGPGVAGLPAKARNNLNYAWKPSAAKYGQWVQAVAKRYSGRYTPKGASSPLPRIHFWSIWNEPNFGEDLAPQAVKGSSVTYSPGMYRNLVRSGYKALTSTGHSGDTILIGSYAAIGQDPKGPFHGGPEGLPGNYGQTHPIQFTRSLYCLDANTGAKLSGSAAKAQGCPASASAKAKFRAQNPGLFRATGIADHPYPSNGNPLSLKGPDYATFPELGHLASTATAGTRAWHGARRWKIYNDEFGWITNPPNNNPKRRYVSPATAAYYMNWAEYLSWKRSYVASYDQYLLRDPSGHFPFSSGLETFNGKKKATYNAFRMPIYLPKTSLGKNQAATVWGAAKPARYGHGTQSVQIQFQAGGKGSWKTLRTVKSKRYFSVKQKFPRSGNVRIAYRYPKSDALLAPGLAGHVIIGRSQKITVH